MAEFPAGWDEIVAKLPGGSFLQTRAWADIKAQVGWEAIPLLWWDTQGEPIAAALVLKRRLNLKLIQLSVMYIPRGPLLDWSNEALRSRVLNDLEVFAQKGGAIFLKIDVPVCIGIGVPGREDSHEELPGLTVQTELAQRRWLASPDQIQFRNTVVLDLSGSEEHWLARMKQKTRYNVRLAQRKGVTVRRGTPSDFGMLYRMYAETSVRDGFVIRPESYYQSVWQSFYERGICIPLVAEVESVPVAGVMLFVFAGQGWYLHGMSRDSHREWMPNYLLQWEAMRAAKAAGAETYDLWGAPDQFDESDSMWGVFRFKEGLGGVVIRTIGAWDYPSKPVFIAIYNRAIPFFLNLIRRRGQQRTRQEVSA